MPAKIIGFYNRKGGVTKTTNTSEFAHVLSREYGIDVLVIDADPQCDTTNGMMSHFVAQNTSVIIKPSFENYDMRVQDVPGDGACFYHAVSLFEECNAQELRDRCAEHIRANPEDYVEASGVLGLVPEDVAHAIENGEQADDLAIKIIADTIGKKILILQSVGNKLQLMSAAGEGQLVPLYYSHYGHQEHEGGAGHYEALFPSDTSDEDFQLDEAGIRSMVEHWNQEVSVENSSTEKAKIEIDGCSKPLELSFDINGFFERAMDTRPTRMDVGKSKGKIVNYDNIFRTRIAKGFKEVFERKDLNLNEHYLRSDDRPVGKLFVLPGCEDESQILEEYASKVVYGDKDNPFPQYVQDTILALAEELGVKMVFIDMPPSQSALNQILLMNCHHLIVPCLADAESTRAIDRVLNTILPALTERFKKFNDKAPPEFLGHIISRVRYHSYQKPPCQAYQARINDIRKIVKDWHVKHGKVWRGYTAELIPELNSFGVITSGTPRSYSEHVDVDKSLAFRMRFRYLISQMFGNQMSEIDQQYLLGGGTFKANAQRGALAIHSQSKHKDISKKSIASFSNIVKFFGVNEDDFYDDLARISATLIRSREFLWAIFKWIVIKPKDALSGVNLQMFQKCLKSAQEQSSACEAWLERQFPEEIQEIEQFEEGLLLLSDLEDFERKLTDGELVINPKRGTLESFRERIRAYAESIWEMDEFLATPSVIELYLDKLRSGSFPFRSVTLLCRYAKEKNINLKIWALNDDDELYVYEQASNFMEDQEDNSLAALPAKHLTYMGDCLCIDNSSDCRDGLASGRKRKGSQAEAVLESTQGAAKNTNPSKPKSKRAIDSDDSAEEDLARVSRDNIVPLKERSAAHQASKRIAANLSDDESSAEEELTSRRGTRSSVGGVSFWQSSLPLSRERSQREAATRRSAEHEFSFDEDSDDTAETKKVSKSRRK